MWSLQNRQTSGTLSSNAVGEAHSLIPSVKLPSTVTQHGVDALLRLPAWLNLLAIALGVVLAVGGLSYAPDGRINILWVWLLWAGLPLVGTLVAVFLMLGSVPLPWWVRRWRPSPYWRPTPVQRWYLLWRVQLWWGVSACSLVLTFLVTLVFTDLAFGWSSTVLSSSAGVTRWVTWVSWPWQGVWPNAVPSEEVITTTRFVRIDPTAGGVDEATAWWPFLLASVLCYNLLPRSLLGLGCWLRWRWLQRTGLRVSSAAGMQNSEQSLTSEREIAKLADWADALAVYWEQPAPTQHTGLQLGRSGWAEDQSRWAHIQQLQPAAIVWHVTAGRSPVAELGDMIRAAQHEWQPKQALLLHTDDATVVERHVASWQAFARQYDLVWIEG